MFSLWHREVRILKGSFCLLPFGCCLPPLSGRYYGKGRGWCPGKTPVTEMAQNGPLKTAQNGPKRPNFAQNGPKTAKMSPPKTAQNGSKRPQNGPKTSPKNSPKTAQNRPQNGPKRPNITPKWAKFELDGRYVPGRGAGPSPAPLGQPLPPTTDAIVGATLARLRAPTAPAAALWRPMWRYLATHGGDVVDEARFEAMFPAARRALLLAPEVGRHGLICLGNKPWGEGAQRGSILCGAKGGRRAQTHP